VTLKLTDIEWSEQYEVLDDGAVVPSSYTAVAKYSGSYSKTDGGEWITSYECDPLTVTEEFLFSKRQYTAITGRDSYANPLASSLPHATRIINVST